jgi:hypothetical protein
MSGEASDRKSDVVICIHGQMQTPCQAIRELRVLSAKSYNLHVNFKTEASKEEFILYKINQRIVPNALKGFTLLKKQTNPMHSAWFRTKRLAGWACRRATIFIATPGR